MTVRSLGLLLSGFTLTGLLLWWHLPGFLCLLTTMLLLPTISTPPSQNITTRSHTPHMPTKSIWHQLTLCCRHGCYPSREWVNWTSSTWWWSLTSGIIGWITQTNMWCALINTISSIACVYGIHAIISHQADWRWNWATNPLPPQPEVTWTSYWTVRWHRWILLIPLTLTLLWITYRVQWPLISSLWACWLQADGPRQHATWKQHIHWEHEWNTWLTDPILPLGKPWRQSHPTQITTIGQLTIITCYIPGGATAIWKAQGANLSHVAERHGYQFCRLLPTPSTSTEHTATPEEHTLTICCTQHPFHWPDITHQTNSEYARLTIQDAFCHTAYAWNKIPPAIQLLNSSTKGTPFWVIRFQHPTTGGMDPHRLFIDWIADQDTGPHVWLDTPLLTDPQEQLCFIGTPTANITDRGNQWRTNKTTSFNEYIHHVHMNQHMKTQWEHTGCTLPCPTFLHYDKIHLSDSWTLTLWTVNLPPQYTVFDYAPFQLSTFIPSTPHILWSDIAHQTQLLIAEGTPPTRCDTITLSSIPARLWVQGLYLHALATLFPHAHLTCDLPTQESTHGTPVWRCPTRLHSGITLKQIETHLSHLSTLCGAQTVALTVHDTNHYDLWITSTDSLLSSALNWRSVDHYRLARWAVWSTICIMNGLITTEGLPPHILNETPHATNPRLTCLHFHLPDGLPVTHFITQFPTVCSQAGYQYGRCLPTQDTTNSIHTIVAKKSPFPQNIPAHWTTDHEPTCLPFGITDEGTTISWDVRQSPHLLVLGKTGSGKSSLMRIPVCHALLQGWQVVLCDPEKGGNDFAGWASDRALMTVGLGEWKKAEHVIHWCEQEMRRRVQLISSYGVTCCDDLPLSVRPPHLLITFDEFNSYLSHYVPLPADGGDLRQAKRNQQLREQNTSIRETMVMLAAIATQGRTASISLLLGAQRLTKTDCDARRFPGGTGFYQSLSKILLGPDTTTGIFQQSNLKTVNRMMRMLTNASSPTVGRGIYEDTHGTCILFQSWWSGTPDELDHVVAHLPHTTIDPLSTSNAHTSPTTHPSIITTTHTHQNLPPSPITAHTNTSQPSTEPFTTLTEEEIPTVDMNDIQF